MQISDKHVVRKMTFVNLWWWFLSVGDSFFKIIHYPITRW